MTDPNPQRAEDFLPLVGRHVIVCTAYGSTQVHDCTVAQAMTFYDSWKGAIPQEVQALHALDTQLTRAVSADLIAKILEDATTGLSIGDPFPRLQRLHYPKAQASGDAQAPVIVLTQDMRDQAHLWQGRNQLKTATSYDVLTLKALESIAFLRDGGAGSDPRPIQLFSGDALFDFAREVRTIEQGRWKAGLAEHRKVAFILRVVKDHLAPRDVRVLEVVQVS